MCLLIKNLIQVWWFLNDKCLSLGIYFKVKRGAVLYFKFIDGSKWCPEPEHGLRKAKMVMEKNQMCWICASADFG